MLTQEEHEKLVKAGAQLTEFRMNRGLTQRQAAAKTGKALSSAALGKLEGGKVEHPAMLHLVALGKLYNKTPDEMAVLFGYWDEEATQEPDSTLVARIKEIEKQVPLERYNVWALRVLEQAQIALRWNRVI